MATILTVLFEDLPDQRGDDLEHALTVLKKHSPVNLDDEMSPEADKSMEEAVLAALTHGLHVLFQGLEEEGVVLSGDPNHIAMWVGELLSGPNSREIIRKVALDSLQSQR